MNEIVYLDPGKVTKDFSKMAIEEKAIKDVIDLVNSGEIDPLKAYVQAKAMTEYLKVFVSELHANAFREADKYPEKEFGFVGVKVEKSTVARRYDFSACDDNQWNELDERIQVLTEKRKEREKFLKVLKKSVADTDTGEVINPPELKSGGKEIVKITFAK